jgi:hypothetical protein
MNQFSYTEKEHILSVKKDIELFIDNMQNTSWYGGCTHNNNIILTGGAFASLLNDEKPKDWDFYFNFYEDMEYFKDTVENKFIHDIHKVDDQYKELLGKNGKMITANSITMNNDASFITLLTGNPNEIRSHFDYVHCLPYYELATKKLYISKQQYMACTQKTLIINNEKSFKPYRHDKFIKRGFKPKYEMNTFTNQTNDVTYIGNNS